MSALLDTLHKIEGPTGRARQMITVICDMCGVEKIVRFHKTHHTTSGYLTFCDRSCRNKSLCRDGKAAKKFAATNIEKYGASTALCSVSSLEKSKQTCRTKYGTDRPFGSCAVQNKARQTVRDRYGVDHISQLSSVRTSVKATCQEKYGVDSYTQSDEFKQKSLTTHIEKYGVENISYHSDTLSKRRATWLKNFGVDHPMKSPSFKAQFDYREWRNKVHKTMKERGNYRKSKPEDQLCNFLIEHFGAGDVVRQVRIQEWFIDMYVKSIDTYVQLDGVYWHGLNRPIHEIQNSQYARDVTIMKKFQSDIEQNTWFREKNMRFIRITDKELKTMSKSEIIERINHGPF